MTPPGMSLTGTISRSWCSFLWTVPLFEELFLEPAMMNYICKIFKISVTEWVVCQHHAHLNIFWENTRQNRRIADILRGCATVSWCMMNMMHEWLILMNWDDLWPSKTPNTPLETTPCHVVIVNQHMGSFQHDRNSTQNQNGVAIAPNMIGDRSMSHQ